MSLLKPTAGELLDRLYIVSLKILNSKNEKHKVTLSSEHDDLHAAAFAKDAKLLSNPYGEQLWHIHQTLWGVENRLRSTPEDIDLCNPDEVRMLAITALDIRRFNNTRAFLIKKISEQYGEYVAAKEYDIVPLVGHSAKEPSGGQS